MVSEKQIQDDATRFVSHLRRLRQFAHLALIGLEIERALSKFDSLMLYTVHDGDECEIGLTAVKGAVRQNAVRRDLLTGLLAISGREAKKRCKGPCKQVKTLTAFSVEKGRADGRGRFCLVCERARLRVYSEKKKAEKDKMKAAAVKKAEAAVKNGAPSSQA